MAHFDNRPATNLPCSKLLSSYVVLNCAKRNTDHFRSFVRSDSESFDLLLHLCMLTQLRAPVQWRNWLLDFLRDFSGAAVGTTSLRGPVVPLRGVPSAFVVVVVLFPVIFDHLTKAIFVKARISGRRLN